MPQKRTKLFTLALLTLFVAAGSLGCPADDDDDETPDEDVGVEEDITDEEDVDDEEDADPPADPVGQLSFDYDNGISDQFSVTGNPTFSDGDMPDLDTFVLAIFEDDETLIIGAADPIDDEHLDAFLIMVPDFDGELATFSFDAECMEIDGPDCAVGGFFRNIPYEDFEGGPDEWVAAAEEVYLLDDGEFDLTTYPEETTPDSFDAVTGEFWGTADLLFTGGEAHDDIPVHIDISNGDFEAGLIID